MLNSMLPGLPPSAVIVLAGISGSGKSSWAAEVFKGSHVLSSDATRGVLTDEPEHQGCSHDAFEVLETLADLRLKYQRLAIIDATNLKRSARTPWLALARKHDVPAIVVWFDTPPEVCARRQLLRSRRVPVEVIARQARALSDLRPNLIEEDWDAIVRVHTAEGVEGVGALYYEVIRAWKTPLMTVTDNGGARYNQREFDVVGDVHGCLPELIELMGLLGWSRDQEGRWFHPQDRPLIFIGDLTDRGPDSLGVLALVHDLVSRGKGLLVLGNHDDKLARWLRGNSVKVSHGLETTAAEFSTLEPEALLTLKARYRKLFDGAPLWVLCDPEPGACAGIGARVVIAHAAWMTRLLTANEGRVRSYCLYGPTTGNVVNGLPQRLDWTIDYPQDGPTCVVGHTAFLGPVVERNNTLCIDTGCVFGGHLSALRWPSREVVQVAARAVYFAKEGLGETPNLIDPATLQQPAQADGASLQGGKTPIPHSIAARVEAMERIGPSRRFDLSFERLMTLIHEEPEAVLRAVHDDPLLLKRTPVGGAFSALTLSNASKLLFTPDAEHQVFAKGLVYLTDPWRAASIPYLKMYNYGEREDSFDLANTLAGAAGISVRFN